MESYLNDDDLDSLHNDPRWKDLKREARAARKDAKKAEGDRAAARVDRLLAAGTTDGSSLYRSGTEALNAGRYDTAEKAFRASAAAGNRPGASLYNAACALARAGKKTDALDTLQKAIEQGYTDARHMEMTTTSRICAARSASASSSTSPRTLSARGSMGTWDSCRTPHGVAERDPALRERGEGPSTLGLAWFNLGYAR